MTANRATVLFAIVSCTLLSCKTFQPYPPSEENFSTFFRNFFSDTAFQRQRVMFPLPVITESPQGENYVMMPRTEWRRIYTIPADTTIEGTKYKRTLKRNNGTCIQRVFIPQSGFQHLCTFTMKNARWYLTKMEEYNY